VCLGAENLIDFFKVARSLTPKEIGVARVIENQKWMKDSSILRSDTGSTNWAAW
jgi:hypothetical protein